MQRSLAAGASSADATPSAMSAGSTSTPPITSRDGFTGTSGPHSPIVSGKPSQSVATTGTPRPSASTGVLPNDSSMVTDRLITALARDKNALLAASPRTGPANRTASSS